MDRGTAACVDALVAVLLALFASVETVVDWSMSADWSNRCIKQKKVLGVHGRPVHDIAWAPNMGRSYHLIAAASREKNFRVKFDVSRIY